MACKRSHVESVKHSKKNKHCELDECISSALSKIKNAAQKKDTKEDVSRVPGLLQEQAAEINMTTELQPQKSTSVEQLTQNASLNQPKVSHYYVESLLTSCNFRQKKRYSVDLEEIRRRCARPECMSLNGLVSYLRKGKSQKSELKDKLQAQGIVPCESTSVSSLCSKLTEGEVEDLVTDLGRLSRRYIKPNYKPHQLTNSDLEDSILKSKQLRKSVSDASLELQKCMVDFDLVTHGMGSKMISLSTKMICHFLKEREMFLSAEHANDK
ncbi:transcription factor AP-2-alpha-like [Lissotriton helveticus]